MKTSLLSSDVAIATAVVLAIAIDRIGSLLHRLGYLRVHMQFVSRGGLESNDFDYRYYFC